MSRDAPVYHRKVELGQRQRNCGSYSLWVTDGGNATTGTIDVISFSTLIRAPCKLGQFAKGRTLVEEMQDGELSRWVDIIWPHGFRIRLFAPPSSCLQSLGGQQSQV